MDKFELSVDREIDFMIKYELTADELFTIKLIFYAQEEHPELISKFFTQCSLTKTLREILKNLQDKGIILKSYIIPDEGSVFNPNDVELNKLFIKSFMQHSEDLGMELFEAYPPFTTINGKTFSLRNIAKSFKSMDDFCWAYGKAIKFDPLKHAEVMDLLEYAKENNLIHSGICDFVISRQWLTIEAIKNGDTVVFDAMEGI